MYRNYRRLILSRDLVWFGLVEKLRTINEPTEKPHFDATYKKKPFHSMINAIDNIKCQNIAHNLFDARISSRSTEKKSTYTHDRRLNKRLSLYLYCKWMLKYVQVAGFFSFSLASTSSGIHLLSGARKSLALIRFS